VPRRAGKEIPGLSVEVLALPKDLASTAVEFSLAAGAWKTVQTAGSGLGSSFSSGADGRAYMFSEPIATKTGVLRVVTHNIGDQDVRLIAVDRAGEERLPVRRSGGGAGGFYQMVREFDLQPGQVEEFRLQIRQFETLEITDVALKRAE
jgi:hypothetical protein